MNFETLPTVNFDNLEPKYVYNGMIVPRVTNIISRTVNEEYIVQWANRLGLKGQRYNQALDKAATYGTDVHKLIEDYLSNFMIMSNNVSFLAFMQWWNIITTTQLEILAVEKVLVCPYFGGTCDLLLRVNGRNYIVDYKTSNHMSYRYFLQLSAYKYVLENFAGTKIDGFIIIKLDKQAPVFEEYVLDFSNPGHFDFMQMCQNTFMHMVYVYYNITMVQRGWEKLWDS